jgi:hypothetical protein
MFIACIVSEALLQGVPLGLWWPRLDHSETRTVWVAMLLIISTISVDILTRYMLMDGANSASWVGRRGYPCWLRDTPLSAKNWHYLRLQLQRSASKHSSSICHCIRSLHNLLNILVQIANKMRLQKKLSANGGRSVGIVRLRTKDTELLLLLCGLVTGVPGYRSRGPGSIRGATIFSEK